MKRLAVAGIVWGVAAAAAFAEGGFFSAADDVPLPPGFVEAPAPPAFEGAGGRLLIGRARGTGTAAAVSAFYGETLPQLGWQAAVEAAGTTAFQRGRERLTFRVWSDDDGGVVLEALIVARPASAALD